MKDIVIKENIHIYQDAILKVVSVTEKYYVGFDILTEEPAQILKTLPFIKPGQTVKNLLRFEDCRIRLMMQMEPKVAEACSLMGLGEKSIVRKRSKYLVASNPKRSKKK